MPPPKQQNKQLAAVLKKIDHAIETGHNSKSLAKLTELDAKFPRNATLLSLLGKVNMQMGRHAEAIDAFSRVIKINPKDGHIRFQYALALQKGGQYDDSLVEYERALYYDPNNFLALRHKCSVLTDLDRLEDANKAWHALKDSVKDQKLTITQELAVAVSGARLAPKVRDTQETIDDISRHVESDECEPSLRVAGYWQLARLWNHLKEYDTAFEYWTKSKEINKKNWDPDEHTTRIDRLIDCWTNDAQIPLSTIDGSRLIFIVGMMRSGTSLTEQMIAQIPNVTPGGEMNAISRQVSPIDKAAMPYGRPLPYTRSVYTKTTINTMAQAAMKMYNQVSQRGIITDKQPFNYQYVPLIAHMFPGCKIIHCVRDAMDCCLSNYTQAFSRPHMQTHDQYWLGRYFRDYQRAMQAWHTLPEVDMMDLQYEDLVADPEQQSKRITEFLGVQWTPDILNYHQSSRTVSTASRDQVRQPMYTSSVQKYKKYEHHLDELKRGLGISE